MNATNEWLTAREIAQVANVTVNAVFKWKREGKIPPELIKEERRGFAKRVFFHKSILEKLFKKEGESYE